MEEQETTTIPEMVEEVRAGKLPRRNFMKSLTAIGVSATGAGVIAAVAASKAFTSKPTHVGHGDAEAVRNIQLHQQHIAKQSSGNPNDISNDYAHHAIVEDSMHSETFVGRDAIMQRKQLTAIPGLHIKVQSYKTVGAQVIVEWTASGIHSTDLPNLPATGRHFSFDGVTVVIRENGQIVRESIYYNIAEVYRTLGV